MVALYRHFSKNGTLLYIGISANHSARLNEHVNNAFWASMISHVKIEHFPDRDAAHSAEVAAIQTEEPLFNVRHQRRGSRGHVLNELFKAFEEQETEEFEEWQATEGNQDAESETEYDGR